MKLFTHCRFNLKCSVAVIVAFALGDDVVVALENSRQIAILKYASPNQGGKFWVCPWELGHGKLEFLYSCIDIFSLSRYTITKM